MMSVPLLLPCEIRCILDVGTFPEMLMLEVIVPEDRPHEWSVLTHETRDVECPVAPGFLQHIQISRQVLLSTLYILLYVEVPLVLAGSTFSHQPINARRRLPALTTVMCQVYTACRSSMYQGHAFSASKGGVPPGHLINYIPSYHEQPTISMYTTVFPIILYPGLTLCSWVTLISNVQSKRFYFLVFF